MYYLFENKFIHVSQLKVRVHGEKIFLKYFSKYREITKEQYQTILANLR